MGIIAIANAANKSPTPAFRLLSPQKCLLERMRAYLSRKFPLLHLLNKNDIFSTMHNAVTQLSVSVDWLSSGVSHPVIMQSFGTLALQIQKKQQVRRSVECIRLPPGQNKARIYLSVSMVIVGKYVDTITNSCKLFISVSSDPDFSQHNNHFFL